MVRGLLLASLGGVLVGLVAWSASSAVDHLDRTGGGPVPHSSAVVSRATTPSGNRSASHGQGMSSVPAQLAISNAPHAATAPGETEQEARDEWPYLAPRWDAGILNVGSCRGNADCPPRHGCLVNPRTHLQECMPEECEEDAHCFEGFVCRYANVGTGGERIRRCLPAGERMEGEPCAYRQLTRDTACAEGLECNYGRCGRPCNLERPACPTGYQCARDSAVGPSSCVPSCEEGTCPDGQRCDDLFAPLRLCVEPLGDDCAAKGCPLGQVCDRTLRIRSHGEPQVLSQCRTPCGADAGTCAEGSVCTDTTGGFCARRCAPRSETSTCAEDERCTPLDEGYTAWACER